MIGLDPDTAKASPHGIRACFAQTRQAASGVYGAALREGLVREGDPIFADLAEIPTV